MLCVRRAVFAAVLAAVLLQPSVAEAFIPSTLGPLQALLAILPQIFVAVGAGFVALFKPRTYRLLGAYLRAHKGFAASALAGAALLIWAPGLLLGSRLTPETKGDPWSAFRGGPERTGSAPLARGPIARPRLRWHFAGDGPLTAFDSSPAVVGNRVYIGASHPSVLSSSTGSLYALDLTTGARVWRETGPALRPIFSSPAVNADRLVSGEGYHSDRDCRIVGLDLRERRTWAIATTSHVESSPCIFENRAVIGAGDDGVWCVELETGRVVWRLEGTKRYELEGLPADVTGRVKVAGVARRVREDETDDLGRMVLAVAEAPRENGRVVEGTIVRGGARAWIEVDAVYLDVESSPVVSAGRVVFGCGAGAPAVACVDAETGAPIWRTTTPFPAFGSPTISEGRVLIGLGNGTFVASDPNPVGLVLCLSLADGRELWRAELGDASLGAVAVFGGTAFACSRDGNLYAIDTASGRRVGKFSAGAPLVCSPAVTVDAVFMTTTSGKVMALDRATQRLLWSIGLTPGSPIYSSPVAVGDALLVGTARGLFCLEGGPAVDPIPAAAQPWQGLGGNPSRNGVEAGRAGLFVVEGDTVGLKRSLDAFFSRPVEGPLAACGGRLFAAVEGLAALDLSDGRKLWHFDGEGAVVDLAADSERVYAALRTGALISFDSIRGRRLWRVGATGPIACDGERVWAFDGSQVLACFDARTGEFRWKGSLGRPAGPPAIAHNLVFVAVHDSLLCLSDWNGAVLWSVPMEPTGPPTLTGDRVIVPCGRRIECRRLVDGAPIWRQSLDEPSFGHIAASDELAAVALASGRVLVFRTSDGGAVEQIPAGVGVTPPVIAGNLLVVTAPNRVGAYDLQAAEWRWRFKGEEAMGEPVGPAIVAGDTLWVASRDEGLFAIDLGEPLKAGR